MTGPATFCRWRRLLYIKSRSLLPVGRAEEDLDENGLTPEEQLVARLNEYRRYKAVSEELKELEEKGRGQFFACQKK